VSKYPPEALEPENLAECIDDHGKKISELENLVINDEHVGIWGLSVRIDELEKHLKVVAEIHLRSIEENTEQIGMIIRLLEKPRKLSTWLAKMGL
jgi:hypothetical protein